MQKEKNLAFYPKIISNIVKRGVHARKYLVREALAQYFCP
jgi:hypothetical protein